METSAFADGFGRRFRSDDTGEVLESLRLCEELSAAAGTESLLVERAARLESFRHPAFAAVRRIERRGTVSRGIVLVSEAVPGVRLADLLQTPDVYGRQVHPATWPSLLQKVVAGVAALHAHGRDLSHGAIGPERIIVRPGGQPVLTEHLLGPAIEHLGISRGRLWTQYRVPVPAVAGTARFDQRCDVLQIGILALALASGRLLARDDFPNRLPELLAALAEPQARGGLGQLTRALRGWLARALQLDTRSAFGTAVDAETALAAALAPDGQPESATPIVVSAAAGTAPELQTPTQGMFQSQPPTVSSAAAGPSPSPKGPRTPGTWPVARRALRVSAVAVGLITLWGATYLGARSYLGLTLPPPTGILVVDSRPAGLEVLVNGNRHGVTPATLELRAGAYTLALRGGRTTALVPIVVTAGQRRLERIELHRGGKPKRISTDAPLGVGPFPGPPRRNPTGK